MRRAEWRRRADDPKGPLGWWWRCFSATGWPFAIVFGPGLGFALFSGSIVRAVSTIVLAVAWRMVRLVRARDNLAPLLPDPAPEGQFRATVEYRRDGLVTGRDEMALTILDGWLHAEGVRSTFSIRPEDVVFMKAGLRRGDLWLPLADGSEIVLHGVNEASGRILDAWCRYESSPEGEPTFPPARAHAQEEARWLVWMVAGIAMSAVFPVEMLLSGGIVADTLACALFAVGLVVFVVGTAKRHDLSVESFKAMRESSERVPRRIEALAREESLECGASAPLESGALAPCPLGDCESLRR